MAIRPLADDSPHIEPLCALKVGTFNCFCMWTPNGPIDAQTETFLTNGGYQVSGRPHPPLANADVRKFPQDDTSDIGSETTASASQIAGEASSDQGSVAVDHPLLSTVRLNLGERSPILRELAKVSAQGGDARNIDALIWEQMRRVATQHTEALGPSDLDVDGAEWPVLERNGDLGVQFGTRNVGGTVHWFRSMDCPDSDIVKGFAAFLEVDLCAGFVEDLIMAEPLGMHTAKRDSVWRTVIQGVGLRQDNIWVHSGVDALDEPTKSLIVFSSTTQRPPGLLLVPPPMAGFNRAEFECTITRLQPIRPATGQTTGFRLTQTGVSRPFGSRGSSAAIPMLTLEESTRKTKSYFAKLLQYLDRTGRLDQRMSMSPRTELYDRVRKHLAHLPQVPQVAS